MRLNEAKVEHETLASRIPESKVAAATSDGELAAVVRAVRLLKVRRAAVKYIANTA